jgi:RES domain-containing protein
VSSRRGRGKRKGASRGHRRPQSAPRVVRTSGSLERGPLLRWGGVNLEILSARAITSTKRAAEEFARLIFEMNASDWARQVAAAREDILRSLVAASVGPYQFERWQRVISYRYSAAPLSCAGAMKSVAGGRFNYGDFDPINFPPLAALYLAEDRETAWSERYGYALEQPSSLTREELALTRTESVTYVSVSGTVERIIDLREPKRLQPFLAIVAGFKVPGDLLARARALKLRPGYPQDLEGLLERLLDKDWRGYPMGFDVPAPSQQFGHLVLAAGIAGIVFPSTRAGGGKCCLVLFPANFAGSSSSVSIDDPVPPGATLTRLTADSYRQFLEI